MGIPTVIGAGLISFKARVRHLRRVEVIRCRLVDGKWVETRVEEVRPWARKRAA